MQAVVDTRKVLDRLPVSLSEETEIGRKRVATKETVRREKANKKQETKTATTQTNRDQPSQHFEIKVD